MDQQNPGAKTCPQCGSSDYAFRSRKKVTDELATETVETKYRRKACGYQWRQKVLCA